MYAFLFGVLAADVPDVFLRADWDSVIGGFADARFHELSLHDRQTAFRFQETITHQQSSYRGVKLLHVMLATGLEWGWLIPCDWSGVCFLPVWLWRIPGYFSLRDVHQLVLHHIVPLSESKTMLMSAFLPDFTMTLPGTCRFDHDNVVV